MNPEQIHKQLKMMQQRQIKNALDQQMKDQKSINLTNNKVSHYNYPNLMNFQYGDQIIGPNGGSKVSQLNNRGSSLPYRGDYIGTIGAARNNRDMRANGGMILNQQRFQSNPKLPTRHAYTNEYAVKNGGMAPPHINSSVIDYSNGFKEIVI